MVKTRSQASDETVQVVSTVGTGSSSQPGPSTGASSSDQAQRPARRTRRKGNVASTVAEEAKETVASLSLSLIHISEPTRPY